MAYLDLKFKEKDENIKNINKENKWASDWDCVIFIRMWEAKTNFEKGDHFLVHNFAWFYTIPEPLGISNGILAFYILTSFLLLA